MFAIVELAADQPSDLLQQLTQTAYRASRGDSVGLVVNGVDWATLQRWLDPVVTLDACCSRGVEFLDPSDVVENGRWVDDRYDLVVASSDEMRQAFTQHATRCLSPTEGLRALNVCARRPEPQQDRGHATR